MTGVTLHGVVFPEPERAGCGMRGAEVDGGKGVISQNAFIN